MRARRPRLVHDSLQQLYECRISNPDKHAESQDYFRIRDDEKRRCLNYLGTVQMANTLVMIRILPIAEKIS